MSQSKRTPSWANKLIATKFRGQHSSYSNHVKSCIHSLLKFCWHYVVHLLWFWFFCKHYVSSLSRLSKPHTSVAYRRHPVIFDILDTLWLWNTFSGMLNSMVMSVLERTVNAFKNVFQENHKDPSAYRHECVNDILHPKGQRSISLWHHNVLQLIANVPMNQFFSCLSLV